MPAGAEQGQRSKPRKPPTITPQGGSCLQSQGPHTTEKTLSLTPPRKQIRIRQTPIFRSREWPELQRLMSHSAATGPAPAAAGSPAWHSTPANRHAHH